MRIAQISATFPPYMAGTGNVCFHNSVELAKLGHDVTVFTSKTQEKEERFDYPIKVVRLNTLFRIGNAPFLPRLLFLEKYDIVHLHYPFIFGSDLVFLNTSIQNSNFVITYHQDLLFQGPLKLVSNIYNNMIRDPFFLKAKKILTPTYDHIMNSSAKKIAEKRKDILEVPNGVDIEKFSSKISPERIQKKYNLSNKKIVLFVGALDKAHKVKGVDILLEAFAKLKDENTFLIIVGDGELKRGYEELARKLNISNKVLFAGKVLHDELPEYYSASDVLVLPSISTEMFGMVLIEAMACNKPVIASNLPGVRTVVDDKKNGFLVEPKNITDLSTKIEVLLNDNNISTRFGENGRKKVEMLYSWKKIGGQLEKIYCEILN